MPAQVLIIVDLQLSLVVSWCATCAYPATRVLNAVWYAMNRSWRDDFMATVSLEFPIYFIKILSCISSFSRMELRLSFEIGSERGASGDGRKGEAMKSEAGYSVDVVGRQSESVLPERKGGFAHGRSGFAAMVGSARVPLRSTLGFTV